jgi:hypothetical protein
VRDRQYLLSLAASTAVAGFLLSGILLFLGWADWYGALGLSAATGFFLTWFYRGPRPEFTTRQSEDPRGRKESE